MASEQIQRGCKRAMEMRATAIKAERRRHKWVMVQATATVMYRKGSSFYNSIINKDGPLMLARQRDNEERQFKSPPSSNTVSLRRISFFSEIRSPRSVTPFFSKTPYFPLNQIKLPLRQSPSRLVTLIRFKCLTKLPSENVIRMPSQNCQKRWMSPLSGHFIVHGDLSSALLPPTRHSFQSLFLHIFPPRP